MYNPKELSEQSILALAACMKGTITGDYSYIQLLRAKINDFKLILSMHRCFAYSSSDTSKRGVLYVTFDGTIQSIQTINKPFIKKLSGSLDEYIIFATTFIEILMKTYPECHSFYLTGHGLGGYVAAVVALRISNTKPDLKFTVTSFDSPGFGKVVKNNASNNLEIYDIVTAPNIANCLGSRHANLYHLNLLNAGMQNETAQSVFRLLIKPDTQKKAKKAFWKASQSISHSSLIDHSSHFVLLSELAMLAKSKDSDINLVSHLKGYITKYDLENPLNKASEYVKNSTPERSEKYYYTFRQHAIQNIVTSIVKYCDDGTLNKHLHQINAEKWPQLSAFLDLCPLPEQSLLHRDNFIELIEHYKFEKPEEQNIPEYKDFEPAEKETVSQQFPFLQKEDDEQPLDNSMPSSTNSAMFAKQVPNKQQEQASNIQFEQKLPLSILKVVNQVVVGKLILARIKSDDLTMTVTKYECNSKHKRVRLKMLTIHENDNDSLGQFGAILNDHIKEITNYRVESGTLILKVDTDFSAGKLFDFLENFINSYLHVNSLNNADQNNVTGTSQQFAGGGCG